MNSQDQSELKKKLLTQAKAEEPLNEWTVALVRSGRKGRYAALKKKRLL